MTDAVRAHIRRETAISMVINAAIGAGFFFALFGGLDPVPVWGAGGYTVDFLPQGFMVGLMGALVPSLLARRQVARGGLVAMPGPSLLPRSLVVRCLLLAVASALLLAGLSAAALTASGVAALPFMPALVLKIASSAALAAVITPLAIRATLAAAIPPR